MSGVTTHVLDTAHGRPAAGVAVQLEREEPDGSWRELGRGVTGPDGRVASLVAPGSTLRAGLHRLSFETAPYFASLGITAFHPWVRVHFLVEDPSQHYHVPLLLAPYGYTTYRGS